MPSLRSLSSQSESFAVDSSVGYSFDDASSIPSSPFQQQGHGVTPSSQLSPGIPRASTKKQSYVVGQEDASDAMEGDGGGDTLSDKLRKLAIRQSIEEEPDQQQQGAMNLTPQQWQQGKRSGALSKSSHSTPPRTVQPTRPSLLDLSAVRSSAPARLLDGVHTRSVGRLKKLEWSRENERRQQQKRQQNPKRKGYSRPEIIELLSIDPLEDMDDDSDDDDEYDNKAKYDRGNERSSSSSSSSSIPSDTVRIGNLSSLKNTEEYVKKRKELPSLSTVRVPVSTMSSPSGYFSPWRRVRKIRLLASSSSSSSPGSSVSSCSFDVSDIQERNKMDD
jgi:hypothetical protein